MNEIRLYAHELASMSEYSTTLPTATTLWKMWKRKGDAWFVGQYWPCRHHGVDCEEHVTIRWFKVVLKHGPAPPTYHPPDWDNYARWKREYKEQKHEEHRRSQG